MQAWQSNGVEDAPVLPVLLNNTGNVDGTSPTQCET